MNNKGFTIVELLASFVLSMIIVIIMFQLIINLKDLYQNTVLKSDLMNKQSIMTNKIYDDLINKKVIMVNDCGEYCVGFWFTDGSASQLFADIDNGYLTYDDYTIKLARNSYFADNGTITTRGTGLETGYNRILSIDIPIYNKLFKDDNFGINIVYPYNHSSVEQGYIDTENGYVSDGLIVRLDGINNTGEGHSNNIDEWVDLSGNGNNATLYNSPVISHNSITFDGESNYGRIENTANVGFPNGITWEVRGKILSFLGVSSSNNVEVFGNWQGVGTGLTFHNKNYFFGASSANGVFSNVSSLVLEYLLGHEILHSVI